MCVDVHVGVHRGIYTLEYQVNQSVRLLYVDTGYQLKQQLTKLKLLEVMMILLSKIILQRENTTQHHIIPTSIQEY